MADDLDDLASATPAPSNPLGAAVAAARSAQPLRRGVIPRFHRFQKADYAEDPFAKIKVLVVGPKNTSKTSTVFRSFAGKKRCISFDGTSKQIKDGYYAGGDVHVLDGVKFWQQHDTSVEEWPTVPDAKGDVSMVSGPVCQLSAIDQMQFIGGYLEDREIMPTTNWVVLDDVEIAMRMVTQQARFETGLAPLEKTGDGEIWQARQMIWAGLKKRALNCARNGLIMTCHPQQSNPEGWWKPTKNVQMATGTGESSEKAPAWFRQLVNEADLILEMARNWNGGAGKFFYQVRVIAAKPIDGKEDMLITGQEFDVTDFKPIPWGPGMKRWFEKVTAGTMPEQTAIQSAVIEAIEKGAPPSPTPADDDIGSDDPEI